MVNKDVQITDPQGWVRACAAVKLASDFDMAACVDTLRARLGRAGAVLRALQNGMYGGDADLGADAQQYLVELALEAITELDGESGSDGIADLIERHLLGMKHSFYRQLRHGEAWTRAAEAMCLALSCSEITELDAAAKALWSCSANGEVATEQWEAFCKAVELRGWVVYMRALSEPEVMTSEKAKVQRKFDRAIASYAKRMARLVEEVHQ